MGGWWHDEWPVVRCLVVWTVLLGALLLSLRLLALPEDWQVVPGWPAVAVAALLLGVAVFFAWQKLGVFALGCLGVLLAVLVLTQDVETWGPWLLASIGLWLLGLFLASNEFSRHFVRVATVVAVLLVVLEIALAGRTTLDDDIVADARGAATRLDGDLVAIAGTASAKQEHQDALAAAQATIQELCNTARGRREPAGGTWNPAAPDACRSRAAEETTSSTTAPNAPTAADEPALQRAVAVALARAERDVAGARFAVSGSDDDAAGLKERELAAALAQNQLDRPAEAVNVIDALSRGGDEIVSTVRGVDSDTTPLALTAVGWAVVAGLALAFYRWLEIRSGRDGIGPVNVGTLRNPPKDTKDELEAEFRRAVIRNVPEPGAVPGADASQPLTDLLDATGDPASTIVKAILGVVRAILATPCGYDVDASVHAAGPESYELFVRIQDARTKATLATRSEPAQTTPALAVRAGGYWAAGWILERSRVVPEWATWSAASASALAKYSAAESAPPASQIELLGAAVREGPTCGLPLLKAANAYDVAHQHLEALELSLRVSLIYPRYLQARYRLAISLGFLASDLGGQWYAATMIERQAVVASLRRFAAIYDGYDSLERAARALESPTSEGEVRRQLVAASIEQLEEGRKMVSWPRASSCALRRGERRFWSPMAVPWGAGRRLRARHAWTAEVAMLSMSRRASEASSTLDRWERKTKQPGTWWQIVYNLACGWALTPADALPPKEHDKALRLLEHAIECEGSEQLTAEWAKADPDLKHLEGDPRFTRIVNRLRSDRGGD